MSEDFGMGVVAGMFIMGSLAILMYFVFPDRHPPKPDQRPSVEIVP